MSSQENSPHTLEQGDHSSSPHNYSINQDSINLYFHKKCFSPRQVVEMADALPTNPPRPPTLPPLTPESRKATPQLMAFAPVLPTPTSNGSSPYSLSSNKRSGNAINPPILPPVEEAYYYNKTKGATTTRHETPLSENVMAYQNVRDSVDWFLSNGVIRKENNFSFYNLSYYEPPTELTDHMSRGASPHSPGEANRAPRRFTFHSAIYTDESDKTTEKRAIPASPFSLMQQRQAEKQAKEMANHEPYTPFVLPTIRQTYEPDEYDL
ncbi:hypothetical protein AGDE_16838 [Angomonas deanei]|nr:hypothetical protein AGDE_16838 [Angomonas deanei]|eukprot:EPY16084.1 hypothetical protein AGDE_16838 [Angomonas deanei]